MVLKSASVLSCLLPARLGYGSNHKPDSASQGKHGHPKEMFVAHDRLGDKDFDPFRGCPLPVHRATDPGPSTDRPDLSPARANNTAPSGSLVTPLLIPDGGVGESPAPAHRSLAPSARPKRSSFTNFFAFSSKRRPSQGAPIAQPQPHLLVPPQAVSGRWVSDSGQTHVHLMNPAFIPSPLRADDEEYYYSCYSPLTPTLPSHPATPNPDATDRSPSKQLSSRQQDLIRNPDLDPHPSSPVDLHLSHTQIRHPYAYSTPLYSKRPPKIIDAAPPLRHVASQPFRHVPQDSRSGVNGGLACTPLPSSHHGHELSKSQPHLLQHELKTSMSTPNLVSTTAPIRRRSLLRKRPLRSKGQEHWLSAESWWDALFSPSPRFKVKQASHPSPPPERIVHNLISKPAEPNRVTFPSIQATRPRAVSTTPAASSRKPVLSSLTRSRSALELNGQSSTSAIRIDPVLEAPADERAPPPDRVSTSGSELPLTEPPLSLAQVLDEVEAFEQQRAHWKQRAAKSLGNKHLRSFSRARSKSLGERHVRLGRSTSESSKSQLNLEFLAARTLLGSQSMMPVVHVAKPTSSSSHSKAHSYSHSQSAHSHSHSSHSRAYSHSHSHSLTASHSSKSSRNLPPRCHSRTGSWSKTAFLKAGSLCGIGQDDSYRVYADERVPSSSRVDMQGSIINIGDFTNPERVSDVDKGSPPPSGEVGIAISSSPPPEGCFGIGMSAPRHEEGDRESRWSSRHTHKSSEYAGPHRSEIDDNLPQLGVASDVSLRHRLPPRPAIHPPIAPIAHPYRSAAAQSDQVGNKRSEGATLKVLDGQETVEQGAGPTHHPHISLSHADFERYGVGEALVYGCPPPPEVLEVKQADVQSESLPAAESPPQEHSLSCETAVLPTEEEESPSSAVNSIPSLTSSTIQMVISAFDNPDDLDEFQDLFYKPHPAPEGRQWVPSATINQVPTDVHSSTSSSPLTHLVRKLSEEVKSLRNPSRTPSDPIPLQKNECQDHYSNENGTKFVFVDVARPSTSPAPMESSSQLHVPIQEGSGCIAQPVPVIPEDVHSSYASSVLESASGDHENDTFGYPVKHGQLEAVTAPTPIQSPVRVSTRLSIQENETEEDETTVLSPVTKRFGLTSFDAVRASYLTTSDISRMSGLSDFPLPPGVRPTSILQAYFEATPISPTSQSQSQSDDETEMGDWDKSTNGGEDVEQPGDVGETLRALRMTPRVTSYESRRSTFGGSDSDDVDFITQLHQVGP